MIDEARTFYIYGYTSDELKPKSNKRIIILCDRCGIYRDVKKCDYFKLCKSCAHKKLYEDPDEREKLSIRGKKLYEDPAEREKQRVAQKKRYEDHEEHKKMSIAQKKSWEDPSKRKKVSARMKKLYDDPAEREKQRVRMSGENNPAWLGGISYGEYCPKFNEQMKRYIRDKYDNCDYMNGIHVYICNPYRKLDVHHIDYNKQQGCDKHEWRLIPVSQRHNVMFNYNRPFWNRLFTYSLQYDEIYYRDDPVNIWSMLK